MVLNVSNDEPAVMGETDEQWQLHRPRDLVDAFDRVGDRQVFRTPSANVAVAMANLDGLPDMPENHVVRKDIKAYLTTAMGQTIELTQ
jgi:hypothetical protein